MTKSFLMIVLSVLLFGCSAKTDCDTLAIKLSTAYERQLFEDKKNDRDGFYKIAKSMQNQLGNEEEAYLKLNSLELTTKEKEQILDEFGALLLMIAISSEDASKVRFYLNNGVDSLTYHKHIGVLALDLLDFRNKEILSVFQSFFAEQQIKSKLFKEIELFYKECGTIKKVTHVI